MTINKNKFISAVKSKAGIIVDKTAQIMASYTKVGREATRGEKQGALMQVQLNKKKKEKNPELFKLEQERKEKVYEQYKKTNLNRKDLNYYKPL